MKQPTCGACGSWLRCERTPGTEPVYANLRWYCPRCRRAEETEAS